MSIPTPIWQKLWYHFLNTYESVLNSIKGRGYFPDWHVWDFKNGLSFYIVPRLKAYRDLFIEGKNKSIPSEFADKPEEWIKVLDTVILAFEYETDTSVYEGLSFADIEQRQKEGFENFAKFYSTMWD